MCTVLGLLVCSTQCILTRYKCLVVTGIQIRAAAAQKNRLNPRESEEMDGTHHNIAYFENKRGHAQSSFFNLDE